MRERFEPVVAPHWASLGLGRPRIEADTRAVLTIDGRRVELGLSPDERHLVVTATAGPLAADVHRREQQLRGLMRDGFGMLLTNRAGLQLAEADGVPSVQIVAVGPCRADAVPHLRELIEDVLHLADIHATTLAADTRGGRGEIKQPEPFGSGDSLIFRL